MTSQSVLVVAAHPDDEALGCGGSLALHAARGDHIHAIFLTDGVGARHPTSSVDREIRHASAKEAFAKLGIADYTFLSMPDNRLDTVALLDVAQAIEPIIASIHPTLVYTHHSGDLNVDHRLAHQAVITALRPQPGRLAPTILSFEVPSSTEWQAPSPSLAFMPNWFQDITTTLDRKIAALRCYGTEMRQWPHSRSCEAVQHLARWRGASVGVEAAEAFVLVRRIC